MSTASELRTPWSHTFRDRLIRPFSLLVLTGGSLVQQWTGSGAADPRFWIVFWPVVLIFAATMFPWTRLPQWSQVALLTLLVVLAGVLFALSTHSLAIVFAFLVSGIVGERLASRRAAIILALLNTLICVGASIMVGPAGQSGIPMTWAALAVGLPVYAGLAERNGREAFYQARLAFNESRRAADAEAREAALTERARIARDIHDVVGHSLSGIALQLDMADALHQRGREKEANQAVLKARSLAVGGMAETRRAVQALREDTLPLAGSLAALATSARAEFSVSGQQGHVPVETVQTLIRAAQEALTNAQKYAPDAAVRLILTFSPESILLSVHNEPAATPSPAQRAGGMGLVGMRERAGLLNGSLRAGPEPDGGWLVEMEIPR